MKITELKCSACNGTLIVDENNPNIAVCEYCQTNYVLEHEGGDEVRLGSNPQMIRDDSEAIKKTSGMNGNQLRTISAVIAVLLALILLPMLGGNKKTGTSSMNAKSQPTGVDLKNSLAEKAGKKQETVTGALAEMVEVATGKPKESITEEDLSRFSWIKIQRSSDYIRVGYSFDNPYKVDDVTLNWIEFPEDSENINIEELSLFNELKCLELPEYLSQNKLSGLKVEGITCYASTPAELAGCFENASELKVVNIRSGLESLEGLEQLKGVEKLTIGGSDLKDITNLAGLRQLKSLTLVNCDNVTDTSVLHVLTWLEELSIESEAIKDISFVNKMPGLVSFSLYDAKILNLDNLEGNQILTSLVIEDCNDLKNCDAVSGLTQLKSLSLEIPHNSTKPDLGGLVELESLTISRTDTIGFLQNMPNLINLEINGCTIDKTSVFSALQSLKSLKCRNISRYDVSWEFIGKIPSLEIVDLSSVATYKDVSVLFNIPTLKKLYLNGMECELDFSVLQLNESMEVLEMDGVKLYKNVEITGGGGIIYVDYDKVTLDEHTEFLTNYPNLKELSLAENKITDISFAEYLKNLETIDMNENYVTDLKPLVSLDSLRQVSCKGNPIENYRVLSEKIVIEK